MIKNNFVKIAIVAGIALAASPMLASVAFGYGGGGSISWSGSGGGYPNPLPGATTAAPVVTTTTSNQGEVNQGEVLGAAVYNFSNNLTVGSQNADVTALQQFLTDNGFYSGPITGYFGQMTRTAVIAFQKAHNIAQVGNVGPLTRAELNRGVVATTPETSNSGLSAGQASAIVGLLQSFGADAATIANVKHALGL